MENFNENFTPKKEWIERCPHCGEPQSKNGILRKKNDKKLGNIEEYVHICGNSGCGKETITNRKILK